VGGDVSEAFLDREFLDLGGAFMCSGCLIVELLCSKVRLPIALWARSSCRHADGLRRVNADSQQVGRTSASPYDQECGDIGCCQQLKRVLINVRSVELRGTNDDVSTRWV
jgi:hypothetical protein